MNKLEAINKLHKAAKIYENNFCNKNLLILFDNAKTPNIIEIKAFSTNFLHLTGVSVNEKSILNDIEDKNSNIKEVFYFKCLNGRLKADDFEIKKDGSTDQKLDVLFSTLNMSKNVKMIGDYNKIGFTCKQTNLWEILILAWDYTKMGIIIHQILF